MVIFAKYPKIPYGPKNFIVNPKKFFGFTIKFLIVKNAFLKVYLENWEEELGYKQKIGKRKFFEISEKNQKYKLKRFRPLQMQLKAQLENGGINFKKWQKIFVKVNLKIW